MSILYVQLKDLNKPFVVLRYQGLRFEGIVVSIDEKFLELYDAKREFRKFLALDKIDDLEVKE